MTAAPLDLHLPHAMPGMVQFGDSYPESPYLFYRLAAVHDSRFNQILNLANHEISEGDVFAEAAPRSDFTGQSLGSVADYHAQIANEQCANLDDPPFHPHTFFVVTSADAEKDGVLVVCLNRDSKGKVASFRMPVEECTGALVMSELGETSWSEIRANAEEVFPSHRTSVLSSDSGDEDSPDLPASQHPSGWTRDLKHFCIYKTAYWVKIPEVIKRLNGSDTFKKYSQDDWPCLTPPWFTQVHVKVENGTDETLRIIARGHQTHCPKYDGFHRDLVVIIDEEDFVDAGVLVGRITEDEDLSLQRTPVDETVTRLVSFAKGED
jgi:hypothetical protein